MNDRASTDSQVFEMIHLDENNEEVSSKDKIVTGSESNLFFTDIYTKALHRKGDGHYFSFLQQADRWVNCNKL